MSVSLCMIVKNEQETLGRCLESVKDIVDEMVIVDTGSTDETKKIAKSYDARIFDYEWNDSFADARNYSMSKAGGDWILIMDADDELAKEDTGLLREIINSDGPAPIYYMKTLCFTGNVPDLNNVLLNLNVRLIKNGLGYHFKGNIHEHPVVGEDTPDVPGQTADIRFYHYGYLHQAVTSKDKRNRNIRLIEKELEANPEDPLMIFYLGNEYYASQDFEKALEIFKHSLEICNATSTLVSKLLFRIAICMQMLGKTDDAYKFIDKGLEYYPNLTDIEFLRADILLQQNKKAEVVRSLNKCIKMGDPPPLIANLFGTGSFRPHIMLAELYYSMGLFSKSLYHCRKAVASGGVTPSVLFLMYSDLALEGYDENTMRSKLNFCVKYGGAGACIMLSDIFYDNRQYDTALYYLELADTLDSSGSDAAQKAYYKGKCYFYKKQFKKAKELFTIAQRGTFGEKASFFAALCDSFEGAKNIKKGGMKDEYYQVLSKFTLLARSRNCTPLCEGEEASQKYIGPIFGLLDNLLRTEHFEESEKALGLLNLVDNDKVLLLLAKTYYKNGCLKSAYHQFERSIKLTGNIDAEGLEMMKTALPAAVK